MIELLTGSKVKYSTSTFLLSVEEEDASYRVLPDSLSSEVIPVFVEEYTVVDGLEFSLHDWLVLGLGFKSIGSFLEPVPANMLELSINQRGEYNCM